MNVHDASAGNDNAFCHGYRFDNSLDSTQSLKICSGDSSGMGDPKWPGVLVAWVIQAFLGLSLHIHAAASASVPVSVHKIKPSVQSHQNWLSARNHPLNIKPALPPSDSISLSFKACSNPWLSRVACREIG